MEQANRGEVAGLWWQKSMPRDISFDKISGKWLQFSLEWRNQSKSFFKKKKYEKFVITSVSEKFPINLRRKGELNSHD